MSEVINEPDRVHIEGLRTRAVIGCYGWERLVKQPLIFDIELSVIFRAQQAPMM